MQNAHYTMADALQMELLVEGDSIRGETTRKIKQGLLELAFEPKVVSSAKLSDGWAIIVTLNGDLALLVSQSQGLSHGNRLEIRVLDASRIDTAFTGLLELEAPFRLVDVLGLLAPAAVKSLQQVKAGTWIEIEA